MALRLPKSEKPWERPAGQFGVYNDSSPDNPSHQADLPTSFSLRTITLEDIDQRVYTEFDKRFEVQGKKIALYSGDAEMNSLPNMNYENFDQQKGFLSWPFFIYTRTKTHKTMRTSPSQKRIVYAVPVKKAQGIVIEEYLTEGPINYELTYEFKFIAYFREAINQMEEQMNAYFKNKRNMLHMGGEIFTIGPADDTLSSLEMVSRDEARQITMYVLTFQLKLWCYTRDVSNMQKRERPNSYTFDFKTTDSDGKLLSGSERVVIVNKTDPRQEIDPT